jgi:prophage regulatory protein
MKLLSREDLVAKGLTLNKTTLWRKIKDGTFPKPILIGNRHAWPENEIEDYIANLLAARDANVVEAA